MMVTVVAAAVITVVVRVLVIMVAVVAAARLIILTQDLRLPPWKQDKQLRVEVPALHLLEEQAMSTTQRV